MSKILVIASFTPSLLNFREPMLRSFQKLGHEVVTCSPNPDQDSLNRLSELNIKHISFPLQRAGQNPFADWKTIRSLTKIMKHEKPDHVFSYTVKPVVFGSIAARLAGVTHAHALITGLGTAFQGSGFKRSFLNLVVKGLYRIGLQRCESVTFQNPDDKELFLKNNLVSSEKVSLVNGSGVDLDYYKQEAPKSLGKEWVQEVFFPLIDSSTSSTIDLLRTTTEHVAVQISDFINRSSGKNVNMLITGGGAYNSFLIERIENNCDVEIVIPEKNIIDYKEALIFAYLGILRIRDEINVLSSVTGASRDSSSGTVHKP